MVPSWLTRTLCLLPLLIAATTASAQTDPIKGQDPETADRNQGNSGWVQAPVPRGDHASQQTAQGAGSTPAGKSTPQASNPQPPPGQNPGTPLTTTLPNPTGSASPSTHK